MEITTKSQARAQGLTHYFTGKICIRGHTDVRYVRSGMCKSCDRVLQDKWALENRDAKLETDRLRYNLIKESKRPQLRAQYKKTYLNNRASFIEAVRIRRGSLLHRIPSWSEREFIRKFYAECPKGFEVDHLIPLQGKHVSGLHVINNLQYLPMQENRIKTNKFNPETFIGP